MLAEPSRNVTVPVGVPAPLDTALTVAVNVTALPNAAGLAELVRVVVVAAIARVTVWPTAADVLELKLASPP
jgi:hypothetical protein